MQNLFVFILMTLTLTGFAKPVKVSFSYNQTGITVIYNDKVFKEPELLNVDFQIGGKLIFFKSGYKTCYFKIPKDSVFSSYKVTLQPLKNYIPDPGFNADLKTVVFQNYVTNFSAEEVTEIIKQKLMDNNLNISTTNSIFNDVLSEQRKFSIGVEVLKSESKNGSFSAPYYLSAYQKIRWIIFDNTTKQLVLELPTEGYSMAYYKAKKGIISSDRLKDITIHSIEEACQEFINSKEFATLISE